MSFGFRPWIDMTGRIVSRIYLYSDNPTKTAHLAIRDPATFHSHFISIGRGGHPLLAVQMFLATQALANRGDAEDDEHNDRWLINSGQMSPLPSHV